MTKSIDKWQFGDFQTPAVLAKSIVSVLKNNHDVVADLIIEPTCGKGAFVKAALDAFPKAHVVGFDVNPEHVDIALASLDDDERKRADITQGDFFSVDWGEVLAKTAERVLVLGNPPWVTSSELGLINSSNLPGKTNFQGRRGIEAITGSGNFDISEWMLLRHIDWLTNREGAIALLCKYSVARKVMRQIRQKKEHRLFGHIYAIDAKRYFSASVEACLFLLTTDKGNSDCEVYDSLRSTEPAYVIGERDGYIVKDVIAYEKQRQLIGQDSAYIWRSGLKHDCSKVMELRPSGEGFVNGLNEYTELERKFIYPLLKSSDVANQRVNGTRRAVIVTQSTVGEDTSVIESAAPNTWRYLQSHASLLNSRRSGIYKGKPPYSIFGVGDYTFRKWKIAISSLYKRLTFCLVGPIGGKPVIFDDTVNFLSFDSEKEATFVLSLLTSASALEFFESTIFWDEKRPITTAILRRLSLKELARHVGQEAEYANFTRISSTNRFGQIELGIADNETGEKHTRNSTVDKRSHYITDTPAHKFDDVV